MKHVNDGTPPVASPLTWGIDEMVTEQAAESIESIFSRRGFVLLVEIVALDPSWRSDTPFVGVREQHNGREIVRPLAQRSTMSKRFGAAIHYYEPLTGPYESSSVLREQVEAAWLAWMGNR